MMEKWSIFITLFSLRSFSFYPVKRSSSVEPSVDTSVYQIDQTELISLSNQFPPSFNVYPDQTRHKNKTKIKNKKKHGLDCRFDISCFELVTLTPFRGYTLTIPSY